MRKLLLRPLIVQVFIDFGDHVTLDISNTWKKGMRALDALLLACKKRLHPITFKATFSVEGAYVTEIDGQANVPGEYYWMYTVNGHMPCVGCDQHELKPGDIVQWEYRRHATTF